MTVAVDGKRFLHHFQVADHSWIFYFRMLIWHCHFSTKIIIISDTSTNSGIIIVNLMLKISRQINIVIIIVSTILLNTSTTFTATFVCFFPFFNFGDLILHVVRVVTHKNTLLVSQSVAGLELCQVINSIAVRLDVSARVGISVDTSMLLLESNNFSELFHILRIFIIIIISIIFSSL